MTPNNCEDISSPQYDHIVFKRMELFKNLISPNLTLTHIRECVMMSDTNKQQQIDIAAINALTYVYDIQ